MKSKIVRDWATAARSPRQKSGRSRRGAIGFLSCTVLMVVLLVSACTSTFKPRLLSSSLDEPRLPTAKEARGGVTVAVEEHFSSHKARRAFDADVGAKGVLPLLVHIDNKSPQEYRFERSLIQGTMNGQPLATLYGIDAAGIGALRDPTWNALVNTAAMGPLAMFFGVGAIAGSASQTQNVNRQIEQHFERMELTDQIVKANERATGFVFFKIPPGTDNLDTMTVELTLPAEPFEGYPSRPLIYRLAMKPPAAQHSSISMSDR